MMNQSGRKPSPSNGSTSVQTQRRRAASSRVNMTAEESLSDAVRAHLSGAGAMSEVKMFGGTGFMLNGLAAAVSKRGLLLRVGKDRYREALARPGRARWRLGSAGWKGMSISARLCRRMTRSKHGSMRRSHL